MKEKIQKIHRQLQEMQVDHIKAVSTSSFQSQSLPLLHMISQANPSIPILFIDTGFHFPETYAFVEEIRKQMQLNIISITPDTPKSQQMVQGKFLYNTQPDYCCHINKVVPLDKAIEGFDVWISGVRRDQTQFRNTLSEFEKLENGKVKYHPMLDWNSKDVHQYNTEYQLPKHPLTEKGYLSIGCMPCTRSAMEDMQREGRWYGRNKKECGIHLPKT